MGTVRPQTRQNLSNGCDHSQCGVDKACLPIRWPRAVLRQGDLPDMREVNGFFLFELGMMSLLVSLPAHADLTPSLAILVQHRKDLDNFAGAPENKEDLPACVDVAVALVKFLDEVIARRPNPIMTDGEKSNMVYLIMTFRDRMAAGLGRVHSYVLEEKGGRSVKTLWTKPLTLLPISVALELSDFTSANIREAAKAWVVDRVTATGFHMMRSFECVLRGYKVLITGQGFSWVDKRGTTEYQGFGTLVNDLNAKLEELKKNRPSFGRLELVIGILRPLSKLYRDPLSHPELKELDEEDAKLACEQGLSAIARMVQDCLDGGTHFKVRHMTGVKF
jgi:hypothetical protein